MLAPPCEHALRVSSLVSSLRNNPYEALGLERTAAAEEVKAAYFERALPCHPDLSLPGDITAAAEFRRISEAYWALRDPARRAVWDRSGELVVDGFSLDAILREWLDEMLLGPGMEQVIGGDLFHDDAAERESLFLSTHFEAPPMRTEEGAVATNRRMRCRICNHRMRGSQVMIDHLANMHDLNPAKWADSVQRQSREAVDEFVRAAVGLDVLGPGSRLQGAFTYPDGSRGCFKDCSPPFQWNHQQALDIALHATDPCSMDAVAAALTHHAQEDSVPDVLELVKKLQPEMWEYFVPLEMENMDLGRPSADPHSKEKRRQRYTSRAHTHVGQVKAEDLSSQRRHVRRTSGPHDCLCGFTSGSAAALARHLDRFPDDPEHVPV